MTEAPAPRRPRQLALHLVRVLLFASVIGLIHREYTARSAALALESISPITLEEVQDLFPDAHALSEEADARGRPINEVEVEGVELA